jgi:hypothetical protein
MKYYLLTVLFCLFGPRVFSQPADADYPYVRPLFDFHPEKPLFVFSPEQMGKNSGRYLRYSALTGYREGVASTSGAFGMTFKGMDDPGSGTRRLYMYNLSRIEMITHRPDNPNKVLLRVKDPSQYRYLPEYGSKEAWLRKNGKCFDLMMPIGSTEIALLDELINDALGTRMTHELCKVSVMVLSRTTAAEQFKSKLKGEKGYKGKGNFSQVTFEEFGQVFREMGHPFLDETNYRGAVDLDLKMDNWKDIPAVNTALKRYGLKITTEIRALEMNVISEVRGKVQ